MMLNLVKGIKYHHLLVFQLLLFYSSQTCVSAKTKDKVVYCERPESECVEMKSSMCLGVKLPYSSTSTDLVLDVDNPEEALEHLREWEGLKKVPKCWAKIQPLLCALYMPNCENNTIHLPTQEMCTLVAEHCQILMIENAWPEELNCTNDMLYSTKVCVNDMKKLKFNTSDSHCEYPLVETYRSSMYHYPDIEGCELQCHDPMYSMYEHRKIQNLIKRLATLCLICNLFTILTFMVRWDSLYEYPTIPILFINICYACICFGWLSQFIFDTGDDIVCRNNGGRKISEPSDEDLWCVINFIFTYYFLIATFIWFDVFTYTVYKQFQTFGKTERKVETKSRNYHMVAWLTPLLFCLILMVIGEIDGDSVTGTCFVSNNSKAYRIIFVVCPLLISFSIGEFYLIKLLLKLWKIQKDSTDIISDLTRSKLNVITIKAFLYSMMVILFVLIMCMYHIYELKYYNSWNDNLRQYVLCKIGILPDTDGSNCHIKFKPSVSIKQLYIFIYFGYGILMSFWTWTFKIFESWIEFFKYWFMRFRGYNLNKNYTVRYHRHKIIANLYSKRNDMISTDEISIPESIEDPIGLVFKINSDLTDDLNSSWIAMTSNLVRRRGAITAEGIVGDLYSESDITSSQESLDSNGSLRTNSSSSSDEYMYNKPSKMESDLPPSQSGSAISRDINNLPSTFPEFPNMLSLFDTLSQVKVPMPNLERRSASTGIDEKLRDQMLKLKSVSTSILSIFSNNPSNRNYTSFSDSDESINLSVYPEDRVLYRSVSDANISSVRDSQF